MDMSLAEEDVDPEICQLSRPYSPLTVIQRPATPALENQICLTPTPPPATSTPPLSTQIADPPAHPRVQTIMNEGRQRQKGEELHHQVQQNNSFWILSLNQQLQLHLKYQDRRMRCTILPSV